MSDPQATAQLDCLSQFDNISVPTSRCLQCGADVPLGKYHRCGTAQPTKVGTPEHLEARKAKCGRCGVVYYFDGPHVCPEPDKSPPPDRYEEGRQHGLMEAAEIARAESLEQIRLAQNLSYPSQLRPARSYAANVLDSVLRAIEAKCGRK